MRLWIGIWNVLFCWHLNSGRTGASNLRGTFEQVLQLLFLLRWNSGRTGASSIQCIYQQVLEVSFLLRLRSGRTSAAIFGASLNTYLISHFCWGFVSVLDHLFVSLCFDTIDRQTGLFVYSVLTQAHTYRHRHIQTQTQTHTYTHTHTHTRTHTHSILSWACILKDELQTQIYCSCIHFICFDR